VTFIREEEENPMNPELAGNIYFAVGTYLLIYMLAGIVCFGTASYLIGRILPRVRSLISSAVLQKGEQGGRDFRLPHDRPA